jgi:ABC-type sugar transport system permease subunit
MVLPAVALFVAFALVPVLTALPLSFTSWDGLSAPQWAGFDNWTRLFTDPAVWKAARLTLYLTVGSWLIQTPISLLLGVYLAGRQVSREVIGAIFFLPLLFSSAAVAIAWSNLLDPNFGAINQTLAWFGLSGLAHANWLGDPVQALITVLMVVAWTYMPFHTLLYQAGARQIPKSVYEAAELDGAGPVRVFFSITLPLLRYTFVTSSVLLIVGSIVSFDVLFVLTGGGPGTDTRVLPLYMYTTGFGAYQFGYSSAIAVMLALIGSVLSYVIVRFSGFARMASELQST